MNATKGQDSKELAPVPRPAPTGWEETSKESTSRPSHNLHGPLVTEARQSRRSPSPHRFSHRRSPARRSRSRSRQRSRRSYSPDRYRQRRAPSSPREGGGQRRLRLRCPRPNYRDQYRRRSRSMSRDRGSKEHYFSRQRDRRVDTIHTSYSDTEEKPAYTTKGSRERQRSRSSPPRQVVLLPAKTPTANLRKQGDLISEEVGKRTRQEQDYSLNTQTPVKALEMSMGTTDSGSSEGGEVSEQDLTLHNDSFRNLAEIDFKAPTHRGTGGVTSDASSCYILRTDTLSVGLNLQCRL